MSQVLFAFFQTVTGPRDPHLEALSLSSTSETRDQQNAAALGLRQAFVGLPEEIRLVANRVTSSPHLRAAGFSDPGSASIGIDIANWSQPCSEFLDEIAWRRVFTWIVGTDKRLTNVAILDPPALKDGRMVGAYAYDADGAPGYGVLQVAAGTDGSWNICDCWGDATDADRIDSLSSFTPHI